MVKLGRVIRKLREKHNISQESLSSLTGIHRTYIGEIERGEANPSVGKLIDISKALDINLSELFFLCEVNDESE